jgi:hypothetical protein
MRALLWVAILSACSSEDAQPAEDDAQTDVAAIDDGAQSDDGASPAETSSDSMPTSTTCTPAPSASFDPIATAAKVSLTPDVVVTSDADDGPGSLRAAIAAAKADAVVGFAPALAGKTIALAAKITLTKGVVLDGSAAPGLVIDGGKSTALLSFNGDAPTKLAFHRLAFANGHTAGSGAAISLNGGALDVEIDACTFTGNAAGEGGAVRVGYAKKSNVRVHDSVFRDNDGSVPSDRNGFSGGAISAIGTNLTVERCRFENNKGPTVGALYAIHSDPVVQDSVFVSNSASGDKGGSGGFFVDGGGPGDDGTPGTIPGKVIVRRSRFEGNKGHGSDGGGMMLWGYPLDVITIEDTIVKGNTCSGGAKGAGIKLHARNEVTIRRTAFIDNVSTDQGGGTWVDGEGPFTFENVTFAGNHADGDRGGGATFNTTAKIVISHVTFARNVGGQGCGAFWVSSDKNGVHLHDSIVALNSGKNAWEEQTGYPAAFDEGGNVQWPKPSAGSPAASGITLADPKLGDVTEMDGTFVVPLLSGSPAAGSGKMPFVADDQRGAKRAAPFDIGAVQVSAKCSP